MTLDIPGLLKDSTLREASNALAAWEQLGELEIWNEREGDPHEEISTFKVRREHLAQRLAEHPVRLVRAIDEMLGLMEQHESSYYLASIKDPKIGSYLVWFSATGEKLLGCCYTIGKGELGPKEWEDLWGE